MIVSRITSCCAAAALAWAAAASAGVVYECNFESAAGTQDGAAITGVTGGTAVIAHPGNDAQATVTIPTAPLAGESHGLRVAMIDGNLKRPAGVTFIPADASHSLNVWFTDANAPGNTTGQHQLNGSMDFFIRINKPLTDWDQLRILNCSHDHRVKDRGIQFVLTNIVGADLRLDFAVQGEDDKGQPLPHAELPPTFTLKPDVIYHIAITLSTNDRGETTSRLYVKEGVGKINTRAPALANGIVVFKKFNLDEQLVKTGLFPGAFTFGPCNPSKAAGFVYDIARVRIYDDIPEVFDALP